ncbi:hypothetical protein Tsubulata_002560 [Turnera subulata]|uniref:Protein ECERIFERUM 26-like n=1 Tax=Turnera subulata TaxID=218843 RepID=A0A9Q0JLE5_9ROSI|nr:hypothetical protein Tsubulata_002560 [Turnera subulata]
MVSGNDQTLVYNVRLSSVGPGYITGTDVIYEPNGTDLAMKLHYLKRVYFFSSEASQGLTIRRIKDSMFPWFCDYYMTCGRLRRDKDTGRPYIKCNDCGVRFIEAQCDKTVGEWLDMRDDSLDNLLVYHLPIGPDLFFSPLLYIQFSCGGMSLGLSWAHILGDAFSVSDFINEWGLFLADLKTYGPSKVTKTVSPSQTDKSVGHSLYGGGKPLSLKRVDSVGDHWVAANNSKMDTFSFHLSASQASHLQSKIWVQNKTDQVPFFESLCAIMWQCIARVKDNDSDHEPKTVTVCKKNPQTPRDGILRNSQIISSVMADFSVVDSDLRKLSMLLLDQAVEENGIIDEMVEQDGGVSDYIVYGSYLTFVNMEGANLYGLEWNGHKPESVRYGIQGVGDEGVVVVLPLDKDSAGDWNKERIVMVTLPEKEVAKISSVGPGRAIGFDVTHEPTGVDLAMKLHYLKGLYFFSSEASQGLSIMRIKESMFYWLNDYYLICGRFRRSENGRPYMKCNDCGVRVIEAECDKTVQEWLEMRDWSLDKQLFYHLPLGPELSFSPSCYLQITRFKCGGASLGLSWAHIIGDAFSASRAMNTWAQFFSRLKTYGPLKIIKPSSQIHEPNTQSLPEPLSLKRVDPVGDLWVTPNNRKMETFSFHLTAQQVSHLQTQAQDKSVQIPFFEAFCARMWQCIAEVKDGLEPKIVTVCKKKSNDPGILVSSNGETVIKSVKADFCIADSDWERVAMLLIEQGVEENSLIEELVGRDNGVSDYIIYGANLTFVDLEEADLYGMEIEGHKPEFAYYNIQGVGDEGAVLVGPWPKDSDKDGNHGRLVCVTLPENEVVNLKIELEKNGILLGKDGEAII